MIQASLDLKSLKKIKKERKKREKKKKSIVSFSSLDRNSVIRWRSRAFKEKLLHVDDTEQDYLAVHQISM